MSRFPGSDYVQLCNEDNQYVLGWWVPLQPLLVHILYVNVIVSESVHTGACTMQVIHLSVQTIFISDPGTGEQALHTLLKYINHIQEYPE